LKDIKNVACFVYDGAEYHRQKSSSAEGSS
jgi:hypothetical protein